PVVNADVAAVAEHIISPPLDLLQPTPIAADSTAVEVATVNTDDNWDMGSFSSLGTAEIEGLAMHGNPSAQLLLAARHHIGSVVIRDQKLAFIWIKQAAQNGLHMAQYLLGHYYYAGIGTASDSDEALFWYEIAREGGSRKAAFILPRFAELNADLLHEHLSLHMHALVAGKAEMPSLSPPVGKHLGGSSATALAATLLQQARYDYETGLGYDLHYSATSNPELAFSWFMRSAQMGYAPAQHRAGIALSHGLGVGTDTKTAKIWLRRAANQGHLMAQRSLAALAKQQQDLVAAYAWLSIAARSGEPEDLKLLEQLARRMSQNEIETAKHMASGLVPKTANLDQDSGHTVPTLQLEKYQWS
ncbi:MAG: tetratricopeptide repeat protein, partial [Candidatus Porifericomitaceae bacterium WSBS_2022_MAG_OTU9]